MLDFTRTSRLCTVGLRGVAVFGGLLLGRPCHAQSDSLAHPNPRLVPALRPGVLTLTGGLGAPYGWGLDYGRRMAKNLEATTGLGYDFGGLTGGIGARYYYDVQARFSTFVGANVVYSAGRDAVTLVTHADHGLFQDETAQLHLRPCVVGRLRVGLRWQPTQRMGISTALGHGLVFGPNPVSYLSAAPPSEGMQALVNTRRPGGVELSLAVSVRLGR